TSVNENLGDEVVVTVIATGIKDKDIPSAPVRRNPHAGQRTRPAQTENVEQRTERAAEEAPVRDTQENNDPFGNWDIRKETNLRDRHNADLDDNQEDTDRGNNIFNRENEDDV